MIREVEAVLLVLDLILEVLEERRIESRLGLGDARLVDRGLITGDLHVEVVGDSPMNDLLKRHAQRDITLQRRAGGRLRGRGFDARNLPGIGEVGALQRRRQGAHRLR